MRQSSRACRRWMAFEPLEERAMMSIGGGIEELVVLDDHAGPIGFDGDTSAYFASGAVDFKATAAAATGSSYLIYDHWGRSWYDAEKRDNPANNAPDNLLCWAATASNVLAWTGWGLVGGMSTTDQIFKYFQDHWTDQGGRSTYGWDWWFDGSSTSQGWAGWSQVDVVGGGFYRSQNFQSYYHEQENDSLAMQAINEFSHAGYGMGLSIFQGGSNGTGHAITCWGYNYNPSNPNQYYGVWVTDSDDDKYQVNAPDSLKYYQVQYVGGRWWLQDYYGSDNWYIEGVQGLAKSPSTPWYAINEIHGTVWLDANGNGRRESGDRALAGETVYLDLNDNGVCDQGAQTFTVSNLAQPIRDLTTTTSTMLVSGTVRSISDLDVTVNISHAFDNDLRVYLKSPNGTQVELFTDLNERGGNFLNTILDDEASTPVTNGKAPYQGRFRPEGRLSVLDGQNPNGTWTLTVYDKAKGDQGTLNSWSLNVTGPEPTTQTDTNGNYAFTNLINGSYVVRHARQAGYTQTAPGGNGVGWRTSIQGAAVVEGLDFGVRAPAEQDLGVVMYMEIPNLNLTQEGRWYRCAAPYRSGLSIEARYQGSPDQAKITLYDMNYRQLTVSSFRDGVQRLDWTVPNAMSSFLFCVSGTASNVSLFVSNPVHQADFGSATSPLAAGYQQVTASTVYSSALKYGWLSGSRSECDRGSGTNLTRDFVYTKDATYAVDALNGQYYNVTLTLGDTGQTARDRMGVFLEGVQVDTVSTAAGRVVTRTYQVQVRDGQLTLRLKDLGGRDPNVVIQGIQVQAVIAPPHREFDFGPASSLVASGYTLATKNTIYSPTWGYGWKNGTLFDVDRRSGTALTRDNVYTKQGTFVVDVLNGVYDVSVRLGDAGSVAHDQMGLCLEGKQVDTVTTSAGQVVLRNYRVRVNDGQLTLSVNDLGGRDPNVALESLALMAVNPSGRAPTPRPQGAVDPVEHDLPLDTLASASAADVVVAHDLLLAAEDLVPKGNRSGDTALALVNYLDDLLKLANTTRENHFFRAAASQPRLPGIYDLVHDKEENTIAEQLYLLD